MLTTARSMKFDRPGALFADLLRLSRIAGNRAILGSDESRCRPVDPIVGTIDTRGSN